MEVFAALLPLIVVVVVFLLGMVLVSRKQMKDYKSYMDQHTAETVRQTEAQKELINQQVAAVDRQTEVLTRIADALERRA